MIALGDPFPDTNVYVLDENARSSPRRVRALLGETRSVVFGLPGPFTPTCSQHHLPQFMAERSAFRKRGVDCLACLAVSDAYVMAAWHEQSLALVGAHGETHGEIASETLDVRMLADGNAETTRALGLAVDLSAAGMGLRCKRFAALLEHGRLRWIDVEEDARHCKRSAASAVLDAIDRVL